MILALAQARILSRHEFSQVKTVRFARTKQQDGASLSRSTDTGLSLVVIQDDGEIAVWKLFSLERGQGHRTEKWQMVNRIPPAQVRSTASLTIPRATTESKPLLIPPVEPTHLLAFQMRRHSAPRGKRVSLTAYLTLWLPI